MKPNYLHHAMMNPDLMSLALFDRYAEARQNFEYYLNEAMRLSGMVVAHHSSLEYVFPEGGRLRFGALGDEYEVMRYKGYQWHNVFVDRLSPDLQHHAVVNLFNPVYNGSRNEL